MTAPDPRVGEIEARLSNATPGPWFQGRDKDRYESSSDIYSEREVSATSRDIASFIWEPSDAEFIAAAPADVAYLLAELADRDEKLARVEGLLDQADEDRSVIQDDKPYARIADAVVEVGEIRAAVAEAVRGGE